MRLRHVRSYGYETVAFLVSGSVMALEIVGTRLMSPYFGTSTYVWTAIIGVLLGAMAAGYAIGGRLADRYPTRAYLGIILLASGVTVLLMGVLQESMLSAIAALGWPLRIAALLAALALFGLPSLLIGMAPPHLAKMRLTTLARSGTTVGRLEAAGALGSIAGTFLCGYVLLDWVGSRMIVVGVAAVLLLTAVAVSGSAWRRSYNWALAALLPSVLIAGVRSPTVLADVDSSYSRYQVRRIDYAGTPVIALTSGGNGLQSAVAVDPADTKLIFPYTQRFQQAAGHYKDARQMLLIGGGAYTVPTALIADLPRVRVDTVEIDPKLLNLAERQFRFQPSTRINTIAEDGRTYLNRNTTAYDMIFVDAYSALTPPFHLATDQAVARMAAGLRPDGAVVANLISRYQGGDDAYLRAMYATYKRSFQHVALYPARRIPMADGVQQGFILIATQRPERLQQLAQNYPNPRGLYIAPGGLALTDDYAPIERLTD